MTDGVQQPSPLVQPIPSAEPCRECGAQLAADQRYCLNCGRRRGEPRLDFRRHVATGASPSANGQAPAAAADPPPPSEPPGEQKQRDYAPLAAASGIAVLGLMLLIGVLIGRGDGEQAAAPAPQVVRVPAGEEEANGAEADGGERAGGTKQGKSKGKKGATTAAGAPPPAAITADDSELEALQQQSGQEYSENSAKLPDEIATEGAPPPEDNKAPGGGSKGTAIE